MNKLLEYPFDPELILKKKKRIRKELLAEGSDRIKKNIAVLGGSTTHDIKTCMELFLLDHGIEPSFYEGEFAQYWQDVMFGQSGLYSFSPDVVFIHTSNRNISKFPTVKNSSEEIDAMLQEQFEHYRVMWEKIKERFGCIVIQNNFEMPSYRLLGNMDASDVHGRTNFIIRLNSLFYEYSQENENFYINDINYLSASFGLESWAEPSFWHLYKYSLNMTAIPYLAHSVANIIKSIYGKNKKSLVLDLDNTLWGGLVGDDGVEGIEIGHETPMGQVYSEFQQYIKEHKDLGIILNVNSKNDYDNAIKGLEHPEGTLRPEDFIVIKANWENKDKNLIDIADELEILPESLVFIDDNPAERGITRAQTEASVPEVGSVETYINIVDKSGFFEVTSLSEDDKKRSEMYSANAKRKQQSKTYENYEDYLKSLEMSAEIREFEDIYIPRITQLTNKSNQFNLTTKRYQQSEIESVSADENCIGIYGKLTDKFGDNGVVSVVIGRQEEKTLHIDLWLMSCRVLKRCMEDAMMDSLVERAKKRGIEKIKGYYYKTAKNAMVSEFFTGFGFERTSQQENGDSVWELDIMNYSSKNNVIKVEN